MVLGLAETARDGRWSTDDIASDRILSGWTELMSDTITEMHIESKLGARFRASWHRLGLGPIDLHFLEAEPRRVLRTPAMVSRSRTPDYALVYMRRGPGDVRHCGQEMRVPEGSFILLDNRQPYELLFTDPSLCLSAHLSDRWLRKWVAHPNAIVARPIAGGAGWGSPLAAMLSAIAEAGLDGLTLSRSMIADQLGALLALAAGSATKIVSRHQGDLLTRLKRILHERFDEVDLDPPKVAVALGISKRHLHGVFAKSGTTFGAVLLDIRLSRAAETLKDPRYFAYRIGDVAWSCGFADPSHLARRFRERFGVTPTSFRNRSWNSAGYVARIIPKAS